MQCEYWTCSAGSGDLVLDSKEPDLFGQLPSVSRTTSAKPSCASTGPTSPSTTMSEPSTQIDLEELISSAEGSPVNRGPLLGSSEAQKMTATSGRSWLPLLKSYGLDGSLARMCEDLLTNRWASSAAFLTWKASGIKPSHLLFQLAPSMPRTDETGSGLWPTPRSFSAMAANITEKTTRPEGFRGNLEEVVARTMWPTPTAHLAKETNAPSEATRNEPTISSLVGGSLNPTWVEWLMGFPERWTDLKPSEMPSSRKSSNKSDVQ
jgi:hypothetical protein